MFASFNLKIKEEMLKLVFNDSLYKYKSLGENEKNNIEKDSKELMFKFIKDNEIINGENIMKREFPIENYDVFLSYSHNDEDLALILVGLLHEELGLKVFIDKLLWGSADELLKNIDDKYCKKADGTYSYKKRNFSTSHIHSMLSTSITKIMDKSEVVIFINTNNSVYNLEDGMYNKYTLSPWIYHEILNTKYIRRKTWQEHRDNVISESLEFEEKLQIAYPLISDVMIDISTEDIISCFTCWNLYKERYINDGLTSLNLLYDLIHKSINIRKML